jgi:NAD-dependent deacetylase
MRKLVVLTGAGISAESGLKTFRDSDGLWEGYNVYDVATPEAWRKNPTMVQEFYNLRRKGMLEASPNAAHYGIAELEKYFDVTVITQNIDNLHERAGSTKVLHLHGEITKARSTLNPHLIYDIEGDTLLMGQTCELGSQLRPHIVWFGEQVPEIENAAPIVNDCDIIVVVGTSLVVYPAAGLLNVTKPGTPKYLVDPIKPQGINLADIHFIEEKASTGVQKLITLLIQTNKTNQS